MSTNRFGKELKEYNYTKEELAKFNYAKITTKNGEILIKLFNQETPNTVANFVTLANDGFYDGLNFHRVIAGFMAQGGCPQKSGMGGPEWAIKCEVNASKQNHKRGSLSMAHAGRDTGGSQFFIVISRAQTAHLDRKHTCFGKVVDGLDIIENIRQGDKIEKITIHENVA